jgi:hypothetical protein
MHHDPLVTAKILRRLHAILWLACVATYVVMFTGHIGAGGSDLWALVKASASTLTVAVLGRAALSLLARASHAGAPVSDHPGQAPAGNPRAGSLLDIVSSPDADLEASPRAVGQGVLVAPPGAVRTGNR